ncbi:MAG: hypothetical protein AAF997_01805 [Myxococcota bacterium]
MRGVRDRARFAESAWMNDSLVERMDGTNPADPLCGAPRASVSADFFTDASDS